MENKAKKILIFSTAYFPFVGGAEVAVKAITDRISDIEFSMITARMDFKLPKFERLGHIDVYRVGIGWPIFDKLWLAFRGAGVAQKLHKKNRYDAIWSIMASFGGLAARVFKKKNPDIKFLLTLQEGDNLVEVERKVRLIRRWFKNIFTSADYIQAISNYLADWAKKMGAVCPIEVVPNGVNIKKFSIDDFRLTIDDFKRKLGIGEDEKVVITVSRLVKKNGVEDLIEAISQLSPPRRDPAHHAPPARPSRLGGIGEAGEARLRYSGAMGYKHNKVAGQITNYKLPVKLLICGDGEERQKLEVRSKKLGISDKVKFMGFIAPAELPKYYAIADVFCRPSLSEGLGNVFLEAMAAGVPVIATPVGGIPDFLKNGETGLFCHVRNPESIAEKIKWILDEKNKEEVARVVANAREMVGRKYDWEIIAEKMEKIFMGF